MLFFFVDPLPVFQCRQCEPLFPVGVSASAVWYSAGRLQLDQIRWRHRLVQLKCSSRKMPSVVYHLLGYNNAYGWIWAKRKLWDSGQDVLPLSLKRKQIHEHLKSREHSWLNVDSRTPMLVMFQLSTNPMLLILSLFFLSKCSTSQIWICIILMYKVTHTRGSLKI